jgi:hypothetical protein
MPKVMVTLELDPEQASLAGVCRLPGLEQGAVDESFEVVNISPAEHLYTILVDEATAARVQGAEPVRGFSPTRGSTRSGHLAEAATTMRGSGPGRRAGLTRNASASPLPNATPPRTRHLDDSLSRPHPPLAKTVLLSWKSPITLPSGSASSANIPISPTGIRGMTVLPPSASARLR